MAGHASSASWATFTGVKDLSRAYLAKCSKHRSGVNVRQCANLAVPSAGSSTLHNALAAAAHVPVDKVPRQGIVHHSHAWRAPDLPSAHCFMMTLRDPVERIESAYRQEMLHRNSFFFHMYSESRRTTTIDLFIEALTTASHSAHTRLQSMWNASMGPRPNYQSLSGNWSDFMVFGGNGYMVPQADYLRGIDCDHTEFHMLCLPDFVSEWSQLRERFGAVDWPTRSTRGGSPQGALHANAHNTSEKPIPQRVAQASTMVSAAHRHFIRRCRASHFTDRLGATTDRPRHSTGHRCGMWVRHQL